MLDKEILQIGRKLIAGAFDNREAMEAANITQDDVDNFRELLLSCDEVPKAMPNKILSMLLLFKKNNLDESVNVARIYCSLFRATPEFYKNRDVQSKEVQNCLNNQYYISLPPTPDDYNLIYFKFSNFDPDVFHFDDLEKTFLMTVGK